MLSSGDGRQTLMSCKWVAPSRNRFDLSIWLLQEKAESATLLNCISHAGIGCCPVSSGDGRRTQMSCKGAWLLQETVLTCQFGFSRRKPKAPPRLTASLTQESDAIHCPVEMEGGPRCLATGRLLPEIIGFSRRKS